MAAVFFSVFLSHYSHGIVHLYIPTLALLSLNNLPAECNPGVSVASSFIVLKLLKTYSLNVSFFHTMYFYHISPKSFQILLHLLNPTNFILSPKRHTDQQNLQRTQIKSNKRDKKLQSKTK